MVSATEILDNIVADVRAIIGREMGDEISRRAQNLMVAGATPLKVIDEVLLWLLHRGEAMAIRCRAGLEDPLGIKPVIGKYQDYPMRLRTGQNGIPEGLVNKRRNLQCMVTRRCNLRCGYCPAIKCDATMDEETMAGALNLLLSSEEKNLRLDFTGGEPLYCFDRITRICYLGLDRAAAVGKHLSFYLVTNATLLDREMAKKLSSFPFLLEISLDGREEDHNRFKNPVDPSLNPYQATRRAIDFLIEEGVDFYIVMVATPETVGNIEENVAHIVSLGATAIDINYAIGRLWTREAVGKYLRAVAAVLKNFGSEVASGKIKLGNLESRVEPSILNAEWMVDTDGSLHLMTEWVFQSSFPYEPQMFSFGKAATKGDFGELYADRFHAYLLLLRSAGWRNGKIREIIHNIATGRRVGGFFTRLKRVWNR